MWQDVPGGGDGGGVVAIATGRVTPRGSSSDIAGERDMRDFDDDDVQSSPYSRKVGDRLRVIRRQKRLSLQEVEASSGDEFKASVLGAYERGERAISVPRLERLAKFYNVPVDQLLPREDLSVPANDDPAAARKIAIDLVKLSQLAGQPFEMLIRFLKMIQVQRQDFNGKVITVRGDDTRAIAAMLDVPVDQAGERLDALDLLFHPAG
jgi:transcriptional regulator with XRE-family HTH domain